MTGIAAQILLKDGPARLAAAKGAYDFDKEMIAVDGQVEVTAADGYRLSTNDVTVDMKAQRVTGSGGVQGSLPAGTFSADRIEANLGERTVALDGHARLRMTPGQIRMPQ
jgi:lipopolysaccharide export system protein LptC